MNDYQIVVDSTADLSEDLVRELDVKVIPFPFTINGISYKHYPDQREMAVADFSQKMDAGALPVTFRGKGPRLYLFCLCHVWFLRKCPGGIPYPESQLPRQENPCGRFLLCIGGRSSPDLCRLSDERPGSQC